LQKTVKISILYCDELLDYSVKPIYYIVDSKKQFLQSELININLPIEIPPPEFV
jgi:ribose 5-phosphate isomerase